ncbi:MAG: 5-formyltetrahydrofolate cyclo-ligase [Acholeplasmatales bacterium]|nr:5-formyltetrahydrofolate cyclo-ligase [Acholeplasmatales bacterium]
MNKKELRKFALAKRKELTYNKDELIKDILKVINGKNIAVYYPMKDEIDLLALKEYGFNLLFPRVNGNDMDFYKDVTLFKKSNFNVLEPINGTKVSKDEIDFMLVPALVINKDLYRIGYGKGYYDRYIKDRNYKAYGVCYEKLYLDFIPEEHDQKLDGVIICKQ